ncbi:MAG: hybrid sensor histidine kinase/response regulator [Gemmatimonadota bacterium]
MDTLRADSALDAVTALGRDLAGAFRTGPIVAILARHVERCFAPSELAIALRNSETGGFTIAHVAPGGAADRLPLLETIALHGPLVPEDTLLQRLGLEAPPGLPPCAMGVPLRARRGPTGSVLVAGPAGRYGAPDFALLDAMAVAATIALEGAHIVDLHSTSRRSWEEAVDAISPALCIVDAAGRVRRANRAFADLVRTPIVSVIGRLWPDLVPPAWQRGIEAAIRPAGHGREIELRSDERTWAITAWRIATATRAASVLLFDDQTERRRLLDQLIQSEKMSAIGQLIAGVAHDLNNPLASVVGFADFLVEAPDVPPHVMEPLRVIQQEAERAAGIVRNLLTFARKQEHHRRLMPLPSLLEGVVALLRTQLQVDRIAIHMEVAPHVPAPYLDANQMQQVFLNLLTNAAQAIASTGRGGAITICVRPWRDGVAVDVSDDGPGMSPELAAQVFEPFFTTKGEGKGTGLGLSISQGIVKEHGGRITLTTSEGKGATFTVELPVSRAASRLTPSLPPAPAARLRILVIDDEPHILHYMRAALQSWGHAVDTGSDGFAAIDRAVSGDYDLIITDLRMPGLHGRDVFTELERQNPAAARRLIFSTGDTVRGDTLAFLEGLGRPYLRKPFGLAKLRTLLDQVARGADASGERRDSQVPDRP